MLELKDVSKSYDEVAALSGCSFRVQPGRLTGFVGPNGAGKRTAMRAIFGLVTPDAGSVCWQGHPVTGADRRRGAATIMRATVHQGSGDAAIVQSSNWALRHFNAAGSPSFCARSRNSRLTSVVAA